MPAIKYDFHGWRLEEALKEVDTIVSRVRMNQHPPQVEIITGHGVIKAQMREAFEKYGCEIFSPMSSGSFVVNIE